MDKNIAVMAVLITAWAITACSYPISKPYEYDYIINADTSVGVMGTGSMLPTITPKSVLYLNRVTSMEDITINDIIYYKNPDKNAVHENMVHRCIYKIENGCITKGDNVPMTDPYVVPFENIKYKVISIKYE